MATKSEEKQTKLEQGKTAYVLDPKQWDTQEGETFGGSADVLEIKVGELHGPFTYIGSQSINTDLGEADSHSANAEDGETVRLPIQATFIRALDQANIARGDTFIIKRFDDQLKKRGKGAGKPMAIYGIKVIKRAPVMPAAPAAAAA